MRERFTALRADTDALDVILNRGALQAREVAQATIRRVRSAVGTGSVR